MSEQKFFKTNYHTHTTFCDGKETAEAMADAAFEKGFDILGFSGHSMYPFASTWHMPLRDFDSYVKTVRALKDTYSGRMEILLGFEADYVAGLTNPTMALYAQFKPDYLIGSVHYLVNGNGCFGVDDSPEDVAEGIRKLFNGDNKAAVCAYFANEREMLSKGDFAILGHPDLIRKNNGILHFFDEKETWYRRELAATAEAVKKSGVIAEINTGAIARKKMDDVYPSAEFLSMLHDKGVPVTINSDAHRGCDLDCAFDRAVECAKKSGYTEVMLLHAGSVKSQKI